MSEGEKDIYRRRKKKKKKDLGREGMTGRGKKG